MQLKKGIVNSNVALSLVEKTTIVNPYYLFEFTNDLSRKKYYQIFTDVSVVGDQRNNWNLFNIEVITSGSGANKIILGNVGQYGYVIYEQASSTNLDPTGLTVVERGRMRLIDAEVSIYLENEIDVEYAVYEQ